MRRPARASAAPLLAGARHRRPPRAAGADRGDRARAASAAAGSGFERVSSPAVERSSARRAVHPGAPHRADRARWPRAAAARSTPTRSCRPGSFDGRAARRRGRRVARRPAARRPRRPPGFSVHRPPGHHAERRARWASACSTTSPSRRATRWTPTALERVMIVDWDVHHGNGTNDIFHAEPRVLFVSIHQSPLYPGTGPASDVGSGAGRGFTVNLPVPPGSGDAMFRSLVDHVVVPLARAFAPAAAADLGRVRRPRARTRWPTAGSPRPGYAAMARSLREVAVELGVPVGGGARGRLRARARWRGRWRRRWRCWRGGGGDRRRAGGGGRLPAQALERLAEFWPGLV